MFMTLSKKTDKSKSSKKSAQKKGGNKSRRPNAKKSGSKKAKTQRKAVKTGLARAVVGGFLAIDLIVMLLSSLSLGTLNQTKDQVHALDSAILQWSTAQSTGQVPSINANDIDSLFFSLIASCGEFSGMSSSFATALERDVRAVQTHWNTLKVQEADGNQSDVFYQLTAESYRLFSLLADDVDEMQSKRSRELSTLQYLAVVFIVSILLLALMQIPPKESVQNDSGDDFSSNDYDATTNLLGKSACEKQLTKPLKDTNLSHVVVLDLNDLSDVNEGLGKLVGDTLLATFADTLLEVADTVDPNLFIGRYSADEFILYFDNRPYELIDQMMYDLKQALDELNAENRRYNISFAYGSACNFDYPNYKTVTELLSEARPQMDARKERMKADCQTDSMSLKVKPKK